MFFGLFIVVICISLLNYSVVLQKLTSATYQLGLKQKQEPRPVVGTGRKMDCPTCNAILGSHICTVGGRIISKEIEMRMQSQYFLEACEGASEIIGIREKFTNTQPIIILK